MFLHIVLSKWREAQILVQPTVAGSYVLLKLEYILMGIVTVALLYNILTMQ